MDRKPGQAESYYDVLRVQPSASDEDIKKAYRQLAMIYHPDRNPGRRRMAELRFRAISEAYAEIRTREKRLRYNRILRQQKKNHARITAGNDNAAAGTATGGGWLDALSAFFSPARKQGTPGDGR